MKIRDYERIVKCTDEVIDNIVEYGTFNKRDQSCFRAARNAALSSNFRRAQLGCVISYKGKIIGTGCNMQKSDPIQKKYNIKYHRFHSDEESAYGNHAVHAEVAAFKSVKPTIAKKIDWSKAKFYIYRVGKNIENCHGLSRPCPSCAHFLYDQGVRKIYYSDDYGFSKMEFSPKLFES